LGVVLPTDWIGGQTFGWNARQNNARASATGLNELLSPSLFGK
jgi:hypothetical protein